MAIVDKDNTFDKIWEALVDSGVLTYKELQYLDGLHQKALALDALTDFTIKGEK